MYCIVSETEPKDKLNVLVRVLQYVLEDESFEIKTPATIQTREAATEFLEWCLNKHNKNSLHTFTEWLTECLQSVISSSVTVFQLQ